MVGHFEELAMRALDDCKTLSGELQASTGAVIEAKSRRIHAGHQGRPSQVKEGSRVHKTLSKSTEGIFLLDISQSTLPSIIKVTNAHESSSRRYSGKSDDATEITEVVDALLYKTGEPRVAPARWFLIIQEGENECYCLRISTNAGRGVSSLRTGVLKKHHSPVYSGRDPPELLPGEEPRAGEDPMQEPIAVESARYGQSLDVSARLLWTQVYKVSHGVETALFGKVREGWQLKVEVLFEALNPGSALKLSHPRSTARGASKSALMAMESNHSAPEGPRRFNIPTARSLHEDMRDIEELNGLHVDTPQYRRGDWVQFASKGAGQTVTRWQVSEAYMSSGRWKYNLVDPDTGKQAQAETIGQFGASSMILKEV
ncbi:hypothetical protein D0861_08168 [Hortaea werneckii]|uniref:DUF6590 domain-containing protein n=1 Tax=Hortaea werneckii TaxID=91943 RepID=A0A3M7EYV5_HORWE|nr:hypothetical protein D0861_08168 [Hortaea werneckii]